MHVIYLDLNIVIVLAEQRPEFASARAAILQSVASGKAIFPYSEIHLLECATMFPHGQELIGSFWDTISRGYHFIEGKRIRSDQFIDVFRRRRTRFRAHRILFDGQFSFKESIERRPDQKLIEERAEGMRNVVKHWASLETKDIKGRIRRAEAAAIHKAVLNLLQDSLAGKTPSIGQLTSEYQTIASELALVIGEQGDNADSYLTAIAFMRDHALKVPAIAIETAGLEALAEQYASDNAQKRSVVKSQLDHDSYDLAALSTFVPYCVAGVSDGNAVTVVRTAYKKLNAAPARLFAQRDINKFVDFLAGLPDPEPPVDPDVEIRNTPGRTLLLVHYQQERGADPLVWRESFEAVGEIERQILPLGGLKVWSDLSCPWTDLVRALESFADQVEVVGGGHELVMSGGDSDKGLLFQTRVPFGMFSMRRDERDALLKSHE